MADLVPENRVEAILNGEDLTPRNRLEYFLNKAANSGGGSSIVPTPEAADSGKVLTAGADGTASWQTASGGGTSAVMVYATGVGTYSENDGWALPINKTAQELYTAWGWPWEGSSHDFTNAAPVYVLIPTADYSSPYYTYEDDYSMVLCPLFGGILDQSGTGTWALTFDETDNAYYLTYTFK